MKGDGTPGPTTDEDYAGARRLGVGCFTTFIGAPSGAMVGVLVAKFVGTIRKCVPIEGLPACDWWWFALAGGVIGMVSLPMLAMWRMRRGGLRSRQSQ
ncbi:MAG: hypothetical protein U0163_02340 [Gemmatimonadaceae bacterium]